MVVCVELLTAVSSFHSDCLQMDDRKTDDIMIL